MKRAVLLISFLYAQDLINSYNPDLAYYYYKDQNPFLYLDYNETNSSDKENEKSIEEFAKFSEQNSTNSTISYQEIFDYNLSEINLSKTENNISEENYTQPPKIINIGVVIEKKYSPLIPSVMNTINTYLLTKDINYSLSLYYDINSSKEKNIIYITPIFKDINSSNLEVFYPLINKQEIEINASLKNKIFGGIDYKKQLTLLTKDINISAVTFSIIKDKTLYSKKLLKIEKELFPKRKIFYYRWINYNDLNNSIALFNTDASKTSQVLSTITAREINVSKSLSTQINYNPLIISLPQDKDTKNLRIANSLLNYPETINEYTTLFDTNIRYNWLNYAVCAYTSYLTDFNRSKEANESVIIKDFNLSIKNNQLEYKTKIYKIENGAFQEE